MLIDRLKAAAQADLRALAEEAGFRHARGQSLIPTQRIPDDLIERDQWVLWRRERDTKVPYRIDGRRASTTNESDWSEYQTVADAFDPRQYAGIGFVLSESDPFVGIDLDNCLEDTSGDPKRCVHGIIERFGDTYMEISPSGIGLKIWCCGRLPAAFKIALGDGCGLEMYDRARYFTVTGNAFRGAPLQIEDHAADVMAVYETLSSGRNGTCEMPKYQIRPDGRIPHGIQHLTLVSLAGTLRRRRVCDQAIEACLQAVNRYQCERPGPERHISRIVHSSQRWGRI